MKKKLTLFGSIASIIGLGFALLSAFSVSAENQYNNDNRYNHGTVINQPEGTINIDNSRNTYTQERRTVSTHEGAGAYLMSDPDFIAFNSIDKHPKQLHRLTNGTELNVIDEGEFYASSQLGIQLPWVKVKVVAGKYAGKVGWLPMNNIKNI